MPRDAQISNSSSEAAPKDYTIPGNAELVLRAVTATFSDNGAGGDWLPCLTLISDSGHTIARACDPNVKVAAGGDAEVTWFPDMKPSAAAVTPVASVGLPVCALYSRPSGISITGDGLVHYVSLQDGVNAAGFSSTDSTVFTNGSTTLFTGSAVFGVQINAAGTYAVFNNAFTQSGGTATRGVTSYWSASNGSAPSFLQQGRSSGTTADTWDRGQSGLGPHNFLHEWITVSAGQTPAVLCVYGQAPGGTAAVIGFQMSVVQWTTNVLTKL